MLINGTSDPINPYQGGIVTLFGFASRGTVMSSVASAQNFATRNGITTQLTPGEVPQGLSDDGTSVESLTWHQMALRFIAFAPCEAAVMSSRNRLIASPDSWVKPLAC